MTEVWIVTSVLLLAGMVGVTTWARWWAEDGDGVAGMLWVMGMVAALWPLFGAMLVLAGPAVGTYFVVHRLREDRWPWS